MQRYKIHLCVYDAKILIGYDYCCMLLQIKLLYILTEGFSAFKKKVFSYHAI